MFPTEPPAAALLPALDRRHVLKGGILAAGALSAPPSWPPSAVSPMASPVASRGPTVSCYGRASSRVRIRSWTGG